MDAQPNGQATKRDFRLTAFPPGTGKPGRHKNAVETCASRSRFPAFQFARRERVSVCFSGNFLPFPPSHYLKVIGVHPGMYAYSLHISPRNCRTSPLNRWRAPGSTTPLRTVPEGHAMTELRAQIMAALDTARALDAAAREHRKRAGEIGRAHV